MRISVPSQVGPGGRFFFPMNRSHIVLRSIVGTYVAFAVQMGVTLTVIPLALQQLGETEYGRWVGLSAISGWATIADMGVSGLLIAYLSKSFERNDLAQAARVLWHGLIIAAGSAVLGAAILGLATAVAMRTTPDSFQLSQTPVAAVICLTAAISLSQLGNAFASLQHARLRPVTTAAVGIVASLGSLAASIALLPTLGATALAVGQLTRGLLYATPLAVCNARFLIEHLNSTRVDRAAFRPFFFAGLTGMAVRWLQGILGTYDVFSVSTLYGPDQAALYANTTRPAGMAVGLSSSFGSAIMPSFSRYSTSRSADESQRVFLSCVRMVLAVCGALAMAFVVAYRPLLTSWIGPEFVLPPLIVAAVAVAAVAQAWLGFVSFVFGGTGHLVPANLILFIEGVVRLALMTVGLFLGGVLGLALAAAITQTAAGLSYVRTLARVHGIPTPWRALLGLVGEFVLIAAALLGAALYSRNSLSLVPSLFAATAAAGFLLAFLTCRERELRTFLITAIRQALWPARIAT